MTLGNLVWFKASRLYPIPDSTQYYGNAGWVWMKKALRNSNKGNRRKGQMPSKRKIATHREGGRSTAQGSRLY
jgi:hypothetical protein